MWEFSCTYSHTHLVIFTHGFFTSLLFDASHKSLLIFNRSTKPNGLSHSAKERLTTPIFVVQECWCATEGYHLDPLVLSLSRYIWLPGGGGGYLTNYPATLPGGGYLTNGVTLPLLPGGGYLTNGDRYLTFVFPEQLRAEFLFLWSNKLFNPLQEDTGSVD
jgi:hypothetical protein